MLRPRFHCGTGYFMDLESTNALSPRTGLLAGALFATAVNMLAATAAFGGTGGPTLVDAIHVVVLGYILAATAVAVASRLLVERARAPAAIARLNYRAFAVAATSFLAVNAVLIVLAARAG